MCGRYALEDIAIDRENKALMTLKRFQIQLPDLYSGNKVDMKEVRPTDRSLVLPNSSPKQFLWQRWGLIPNWAKAINPKLSTTNARGEELTAKPMYAPLITTRRCVVAATSWFEWAGSPKTMYRFRHRQEKLMAFAGLWDSWTDPISQEIIDSFTIITIGAHEAISHIHDRMPVILEGDEMKHWLEDGHTQQDYLSLLQAYPGELLEVEPVGLAKQQPKPEAPKLKGLFD